MILLDASVAAKLVIAEDGSAAATELVESAARVTAPSIIRIEVSGAIVRRFRQGKFDQEDARDASARWLNLLSGTFDTLIPFEEIHADAMDLAFKLRHPLMDCFYLAAAMMMNCPFITADQALFDRGRAVHADITLLPKDA